MFNRKSGRRLIFGIIIFSVITCKNKSAPVKKEIVVELKSMDAKVQEKIFHLLEYAKENNKKIDDSNRIIFLKVVNNYYETYGYVPKWCSLEKWNPVTDSIIIYLKNAAQDGLFREDYHFDQLKEWHKIKNDSSVRMNAEWWAKGDLLLTDAIMRIFQDLKQGRLQPDSLAWRNDTSRFNSFFISNIEKLRLEGSVTKIIRELQPTFHGYVALKKLIPRFIELMDNNYYTYLRYPYKDSLAFIKNLKIRLGESGILISPSVYMDSVQLSDGIKQYQSKIRIKVTGKISSGLVQTLNLNDREKFTRIAIALDKYKKLPVKMPGKYIWVNIPAYNLTVWDNDSLVFNSRIICGKPATPTPILTSAISDMIIYPTWTVPASIIKKEMLPGLKKNSGYLAGKGLSLINEKGDSIDPASVNWAKYSKGIPYRIQQGSGDDNAMGVIKFNFNNPFSVYLHDTNQRYLFKKNIRCLSHGCVRVEEWNKLAFYILRNDSIQVKKPGSSGINTDSITSWIAQKEKHTISITYKFPLFIRYIGCEAVNGTLKFYDDIYGDDRILREKYFAAK